MICPHDHRECRIPRCAVCPAPDIVARDLCDFATTAGELAVVLAHVGKALGETYAEGDPSESVCRAAIADLRDARHRIAELIGELEQEVGP